MKLIKTIEKKTEKSNVVDKIICDICKEDVDSHRGSWESNEIIIGAKLGDVYPGFDGRNVSLIDCCAKCFKGKIQPLIEKTFGINFREMDIDDMYKYKEGF